MSKIVLCRPCTYFAKFLFIFLCGTFVNGIVTFFIFRWFILVYRHTIYFCVLISYSVISLNFINRSTCVYSYPLQTELYCKWRQFYFFFSNLDAFYFSFLWLYWLEPPVLCWTKVVRADILVLFLHHYDINCRFFTDALYHIEEGLFSFKFAENFFYSFMEI